MTLMFSFVLYEIYFFFSKKGFNVKSYGTGNMVKLPGPAPDKPNIYDFCTTYEAMYQDLRKKDFELYPFPCIFFNAFKKYLITQATESVLWEIYLRLFTFIPLLCVIIYLLLWSDESKVEMEENCSEFALDAHGCCFGCFFSLVSKWNLKTLLTRIVSFALSFKL